jgi:hypothetical protein
MEQEKLPIGFMPYGDNGFIPGVSVVDLELAEPQQKYPVLVQDRVGGYAMTGLFDPVAAKKRLEGLQAEREQTVTENRTHEVELLTGGTADRLDALSRLKTLDTKIRDAKQSHETATAYTELRTNREAERPTLLQENLTQLGAYEIPEHKELSIDYLGKQLRQRQAARTEVTRLAEELAGTKADNAKNIAELMHGDAADRIDARRKLAELKKELARARGRLASIDAIPETNPETDRHSLLARSLGKLALSSVIAFPNEIRIPIDTV